MESIRAYILSVVAASILSSILLQLIGKKSSYAAIIRLISGIFLAVTVASPWAKLQISNLSDYIGDIEADAGAAAAAGEEALKEELAAIIKGKSEAYILDKATSMGLDIGVEVTLDDSAPPVPCSVTITGSISPYQKQKLQKVIAEEIGILEEYQKWS